MSTLVIGQDAAIAGPHVRRVVSCRGAEKLRGLRLDGDRKS
jgi:hypothetical protein